MDTTISKNTAEIIELMEAGQKTQFWAKLVEITQENVKLLEGEILSKLDAQDGHTLTDLECDHRRNKREALLDLISLPGQIISESVKEDVGEEEHDPYPKTKADLREPENTG